MAYNPRDHYFKLAKQKNFLARSIFKLEEIDQKFRVLKPSQTVLDLGAAPGSWSQYALSKIGSGGLVIACDPQPIKLSAKNLKIVQGLVSELDIATLLQQLGKGKLDVVLSDMAPNTSGIKVRDQALSLELCESALQISQKFLRKGGHFVCKLFHSEDFASFKQALESDFARVAVLKPDSTRKSSKEVFMVAQQFQGSGSS